MSRPTPEGVSHPLPFPLSPRAGGLAEGHGFARQDAGRGGVAVLLLEFGLELADLVAERLRALGLEHLATCFRPLRGQASALPFGRRISPRCRRGGRGAAEDDVTPRSDVTR